MLTKNPQFRVYRKRSLEEKNIKNSLTQSTSSKGSNWTRQVLQLFSASRKKTSLLFRDLETSKKRYLTSSKNNRKLHPIQVRKDKFIVICFLWVAVIHDQIGLWTLLHDAEHSVVNRVGKGMEIPGAHLTVEEVFDVDSKNRCTFAWKSGFGAKDQKEKMVVCAMILKVMASRETVDSVELRRLSRDLLTKTKLCLQYFGRVNDSEKFRWLQINWIFARKGWKGWKGHVQDRDN